MCNICLFLLGHAHKCNGFIIYNTDIMLCPICNGNASSFVIKVGPLYVYGQSFKLVTSLSGVELLSNCIIISVVVDSLHTA